HPRGRHRDPVGLRPGHRDLHRAGGERHGQREGRAGRHRLGGRPRPGHQRPARPGRAAAVPLARRAVGRPVMSRTTAATTGADTRPARYSLGVLAGVLHRWLALVVVVVLWELGTRAAKSVFFPPPSKIVKQMYHLWFSGPVSHLFLTSTATDNILPSLARMAVGLAASTVVGVALGLLLGPSDRMFAYLDPLFQFFRVIPPPTLAPVFVVLFTFGTPMQLASIIFSAIWPILLNTAAGA